MPEQDLQVVLVYLDLQVVLEHQAQMDLQAVLEHQAQMDLQVVLV